MSYARAILQRDVRKEAADLQKKAKKKGLWGSLGRTLGSLAVMAVTGGTVNPITLGLLTGGASAIGGAIGAKAAGGKLTGGKFFRDERADLQSELGAFGSENLMSSLKSGITAGIGQKLKLMKSGETAAKGLDFKGSFVGKGLAKAEAAKELSAMRGWQGQYEAEQLAGIGGGKSAPTLWSKLSDKENIVSPTAEATSRQIDLSRQAFRSDHPFASSVSGSGTSYITEGLSTGPTDMIGSEWVGDMYQKRASNMSVSPIFQTYDNIGVEDWSKTAKGFK